MCRLMGFVSRESLEFPTLIGEHFSEFVALSNFHKDGWGIAINNAHRPQVLLVRAPEPAKVSAQFQEQVHQLHGDGGLLHLRWATSGLDSCDTNTHPFVHGQYSFIHNGDIRPREKLDSLIRPELDQLRLGDTDSERYFYLLLTELEKDGLIEGAQSAVRLIKSECTYSSINAMLLTPEYFLVINEYNNDKIPAGQPSDYYELRYKISEKSIVVASSGWPQNNWTSMKNHSLMLVNRENLTEEIYQLD